VAAEQRRDSLSGPRRQIQEADLGIIKVVGRFAKVGMDRDIKNMGVFRNTLNTQKKVRSFNFNNICCRYGHAERILAKALLFSALIKTLTIMAKSGCSRYFGNSYKERAECDRELVSL
jgi:hypothetical protein